MNIDALIGMPLKKACAIVEKRGYYPVCLAFNEEANLDDFKDYVVIVLRYNVDKIVYEVSEA